ncbi:MAG: tetratricopeptide repeat protein [Planctomycetes bacterium]|nr:tetratricopeptide repeat protein [Planctomycetota bacterium]
MSLIIFNPFKFFKARQLKKALADYEKNPGLEETVSVVQLFLKCGRCTEAFQHAEAGRQKFPASSELNILRQLAYNKLGALECRALAKQIAAHPRPETIAKAVEIWRSCENYRQCERLRHKWRDRFPDSWILQFAIGKYLFHRSLDKKIKDQSSEIKVQCLEQLKRAAALNPDNYKSLLYLATILSGTGSVSDALKTLDRLLKLYPGDQRAVALRERIQRSQRGRQAPPGPFAAEAFKAPREAKAGQEGSDDIFNDLRESPSIFAAVIEEGPKDNLQAQCYFAENSCFNFEQGEAAFRDLMHALRAASKRMGLGELKTCILEGGSWRIFLGNHPVKSLLICTDKNFQETRFETAIRRIIQEKVLA